MKTLTLEGGLDNIDGLLFRIYGNWDMPRIVGRSPPKSIIVAQFFTELTKEVKAQIEGADFNETSTSKPIRARLTIEQDE